MECFCEYFTSVSTTEELRAALLNEDFSQRFILGGGSNLLLTKNLSGLCIHVDLKGIRIVEENDDLVIIEASAGENWHEFVLWTIENGWGGVPHQHDQQHPPPAPQHAGYGGGAQAPSSGGFSLPTYMQ